MQSESFYDWPSIYSGDREVGPDMLRIVQAGTSIHIHFIFYLAASNEADATSHENPIRPFQFESLI